MMILQTQLTVPAELADAQATATQAPIWQMIVWDDPVNLTDYVTYVFRRHFGYSQERAEELMWQVHNEGRAIVTAGERDLMVHHCEAMHTYGLWATVAQAQ